MDIQRPSEHADITGLQYPLGNENGLEMPIFNFEITGLPFAYVVISWTLEEVSFMRFGIVAPRVVCIRALLSRSTVWVGTCAYFTGSKSTGA